MQDSDRAQGVTQCHTGPFRSHLPSTFLLPSRTPVISTYCLVCPCTVVPSTQSTQQVLTKVLSNENPGKAPFQRREQDRVRQAWTGTQG